jgi:predicted Rossmann fold flavoprotein
MATTAVTAAGDRDTKLGVNVQEGPLSKTLATASVVKQYDVVVLGGGAAGLMCAIAAGKRGRRVAVLEGSNKIGKKILMSGGGRCNFTNLYCEPRRFISANPSFCISALSRYTQQDFIALVDKHDIAYHEKGHGELFCNQSSKQILTMLVNECAQVNVDIFTSCKITSVDREAQFNVQCSVGAFRAQSLVVATGGLSIPKMGASDFGYRLARQFGLRVEPTRAGLVPFTFTGATQQLAERLTGISLGATLSTAGEAFTENILFTHRGLSGPAALQLSSYWHPGSAVKLDLFPRDDAASLLLKAKAAQPKALARTVLADWLPRALVVELQALFWPTESEKPLAEIPDAALRRVGTQLQQWQVKPAATEGYRTAEVTLGGIDTTELSSKTMESKQLAGLYCIGEVVDVTGHLGGFNFQWAWSSGQAAGKVA